MCFFGGVHGVVCVFLLVVLIVVGVVFLASVFMEFLMAFWVQWFCWASHETPNKTAVSPLAPSENDIYILHLKKKKTHVFPKATVEPLRVAESHIAISRSHCRATPCH